MMSHQLEKLRVILREMHIAYTVLQSLLNRIIMHGQCTKFLEQKAITASANGIDQCRFIREMTIHSGGRDPHILCQSTQGEA